MAGRDDMYEPQKVQIPYDIFMLICKEFLTCDITPSERMETVLYLRDKVRRMYNHVTYTPKARKQQEGPKEDT